MNIQKFVSNWSERLLNSRAGNVGIALSGGVDSMCLTFLCAEIFRKNQCLNKLFTITVDHGLRPESSVESSNIQQYVQSCFGVQSTVSKIDWGSTRPSKLAKNFEGLARVKRYEEIKKFCESKNINTLLMGHNLNDQVETMIMRLRKIEPHHNFSNKDDELYYSYSLCGIKQNSTIESITPGKSITILRPLLSVYKSEIIKTCEENQIVWFQDKSNFDTDITERNEIREKLDPKGLELNTQRLNYFEGIMESIEQEKEELWSQCSASECLNLSSLSLKIPEKVFKSVSSVAFDRLLFEKTHKISSMPHHHYKFQKFRGLKDQLSSESKVKLPGFRVETAKDADYLYLELFRPKMYKTQILKDTHELILNTSWSKWIEFDSRFCLRFRSESLTQVGQKVIVTVFDHKKHKSSGKVMKDLGKLASRYQLPVIIDTDFKVLGFPTLLCDVYAQWVPI